MATNPSTPITKDSNIWSAELKAQLPDGPGKSMAVLGIKLARSPRGILAISYEINRKSNAVKHLAFTRMPKPQLAWAYGCM